MRIAWLTDLHLESLPSDEARSVGRALETIAPDAALVTGDIGAAGLWRRWIGDVAASVRCPVYFVLGNHDFYGGWIAPIELAASSMREGVLQARYLSTEPEPIELTPGVGLVGHDAWADARLGVYDSAVTKNAAAVNDLARLTDRERADFLAGLGDRAAAHLGRVLASAASRFRRVLVATHTPPFVGNLPVDPDWLPHVVCHAAGRAIADAAAAAPDCSFEVYSGHTHQADFRQVLPNLAMHVGAAQRDRLGEIDVIEI